MKVCENANKIKIYEVAAKLFYQNGYSNTSVDSIIEESQTSKGTFYHYYKNKAELGISVLENSYNQHNAAYKSFIGIDQLVLLALDIRVFWFSYYQDEGYRRFFYDMSRELLNYDSYRIIKICIDHTNKKFTKNELDLILISIQGMRHRISMHIYDKLESFPCASIAEFSMNQIFRFFEIPSKVIKETMKESKKIFDQLEIKVEEFNYYPKLTE